MFDKIMDFLDKIGPLLYVVVPAIFGIYYNLREKVKTKEKEIKKTNKAKAKQAYTVWEHDESQRVIIKIKDLCNVYKDKSNAGLAQYLQLENGTVATSKICNMFISCLAEDDRYGRVPKLSSRLQRLPYSKVTGWIGKIIEIRNTDMDYILTEDVSKADYSIAEIVDAPEIRSVILAPVYDPNNTLLGMCVFYYADINFDGNKESEIQLINKFRCGVEQVLVEYHMDRSRKMKELGLESGLDD